jgi:hypothetical protein
MAEEVLPLPHALEMLAGRDEVVSVAELAACEASLVATACTGLRVSSFDDTCNPICNTLDSCDRQLTTSPCFIIASRAFSFASSALS